MSDTLTVPARWTNDCQGKKDFDGNLVVVSTRYWPRGGGFHISRGGYFVASADLYPDVRPSATSHIAIRHGDPGEDGYGSDLIDLVARDFEADTQEEVQAQVEAWVAAQFARVIRVLRHEFSLSPTPT